MILKRNWLKSSDIRECKFIFNYAKINYAVPYGYKFNVSPETKNNYVQAIETIFSNINKPELTERFFNEINDKLRTNFIPTSEFKWIEQQSDRMQYWIWCYCRLARGNPLQKINSNLAPYPNYMLPDVGGTQGCLYKKFNLNIYPTTSKQQKELIFEFLDHLLLEPYWAVENIRSLMIHWQHRWVDVFNVENFRWLKKNNSFQCEWAWEYLYKSKLLSFKTSFIPPPSNTLQFYNAIIGAFDINIIPPSDKKLFMHKMKKASEQKLRRNAMKGKKSNVLIGSDAKKKLDILHEITGWKQDDYVNYLINQEFERIKKSSSL